MKIFNPGAGFTVGGVSNIYLGRNFYLEPGISFFYSQYRYDLVIGAQDLWVEKNPKVYKLGLQIPLMVGYTFDFSDRFGMSIYTGPQMRYALGGAVEFSNKELITDTKDILDIWETQRRFDLSWKIGIGFPVSNFLVSFEADLGITNLLKEDMKFRENRVGLGLTYYF